MVATRTNFGIAEQGSLRGNTPDVAFYGLLKSLDSTSQASGTADGNDSDANDGNFVDALEFMSHEK
jgi:hypothetical protein